MIYDAKLLTLGETAHALSRYLGPERNWANFLTDCIRNRQHLAGYALMPSARLQDARGFRPAYSIDSIKAFIRAVKTAMPGLKPGVRPVAVTLDTRKGWLINKFDRKGNPVARYQGMPHACTSPRFTTT